MLGITAIILTKDERVHIERCIERLRPVAERIIVVDSLSTDGTQEIARAAGADVVEHVWPGNQAAQFNWALDNLKIDSEWILRLDADEYLSSELIEELQVLLPSLPESITAVSMPRGRVFMGRRLRHGIVNNVDIVRIFRRGCARYENRIMDEHLVILRGDTVRTNNLFFDDNRMPLSDFIKKHDNYAIREAALSLAEEFSFDGDCKSLEADLGTEVTRKRQSKDRYARMPLFWRAFAYFVYRYFIKLGFLDGKEGFLWDFFQGWWYRTLVDAKIYEIKKACDNDPERIRQYLKANYNISV